ncbi:hypothetical protein TIFTF001_039870 [Ficus carica]|uniref:Receptor-like protein 12 n=1 Tax=Ficus carica TaxID=3494 RepID=A0AA87YP54_FICCA|nr:hypothetical protein TIFTF001_039870 [Ficus carica]
MPTLKYLVLDDNLLTGPLRIQNVSSSPLILLSLNGNMLHGQIPSSIAKFPNLRSLLLKSSNLSGYFDFSIFPGLSILDLSNNSLTGTLPKCFSSSLSQFNLQENNFYGNIPELCSDECNLRVLSLGYNHLQGKFPESLTKCGELRILDIQNNQIVNKFPFCLQALPKLAVLSLSHNNFHGPIWDPSEYWGFANLRAVDLSSNKFTGSLPSDYFKNWSALNVDNARAPELYMKDENGYYRSSITLAWKGNEATLEHIYTIFEVIDLSNNQFQGEIPDSIGDLLDLVALNLSGNSFTSIITLSIGKLTNLESLDLSRNKLTGRIPAQLTDLIQLEVLNLTHNQLMGPIPRGYQFDTFANDSYEGNMGLCGHPLSNKCENSEEPTSHSKVEPESDDSFGWKSILWGYGCGLVTGLIAGLVAGHIIISKKLNWFVETSAEYIRGHIIRKRRS